MSEYNLQNRCSSKLAPSQAKFGRQGFPKVFLFGLKSFYTCLLTLALVIPAVPVASLPSHEAPSGEHQTENRGNTVGNSVNWGVVVEHNGAVFYSSALADPYHAPYALYKLEEGGRNRVRVFDAAGYNLNSYEGMLYFISFDNRKIIRMCTKTGIRQTISSDQPHSFSIVDGWIYYINMDDENKIYRIRPDGKDKEKLSDDSTDNPLNIADGWIYYIINFNETKGPVYRMRTDGSEREQLRDADWNITFIHVDGSWVYYVNYWEYKIQRIPSDGSPGWERINNDWSQYLNIVDGWIYYVNASHNNAIYRIRLDGSGKQRLSGGGNFSNINIVDGWIYYMHSGLREIYRMRLDGSDSTRLSDIPLFPDERRLVHDIIDYWRDPSKRNVVYLVFAGGIILSPFFFAATAGVLSGIYKVAVNYLKSL